MIEHIVPGGPAFVSTLLEKGDKILKVDGTEVHSDDVDHYLSGRSGNDEDGHGELYVKITLEVEKSTVSVPCLNVNFEGCSVDAFVCWAGCG